MTPIDKMTLIDRLKDFEADTKWIGNHYEELKQKYPDEWIAVHNGVVVEHGQDSSPILETLKKRFPDDHKHMPTEYISTKDTPLILGI